MEYQVFLTPKAKRDLLAIWKFIAKQDSDTATRFCNELTLHAHSLKIFPERVESLPRRKFARKVPYESYLIYYKVDDATRTVDVLRFRHSSRDEKRLRFKEATSEYPAAPAKLEA